MRVPPLRLPLAAALATALPLLAACDPPRPAPTPAAPAPLSILDLMRADGGGAFERAIGARPLSFPADHGPHPRFRTEWWYWTGNLSDAEGRAFGYQLTMFRDALGPPVERASAWGADSIYLAHLAITDARSGRFHSAERFSRAALGLAGAAGEPMRVWVGSWRAEQTAPGRFRLRAGLDGAALDLELAARKPLVAQGAEGRWQKGDAPGNASYYYSWTRLATTGSLSLAGRVLAVSGSSWMDREWASGALTAEQSGWDWFALQLEDGSDLMYYRLRRLDGTPDPHSAGVLVDAQGAVRRLDGASLTLRETAAWESPASGVRYPAGWTLSVAGAGLTLEVEPLVADQELRHRLRYWEGAVTVRGRRGERALDGRGYVELVGYEPPVR